MNLPTGRVRRIAPLAAATAVSAVGRAAGRIRRGSDPGREAELLVKEAERYAYLLGDMKGAVMKLGQLLSFLDADLVPEAYRPAYQQALAVLQADAPPMSSASARAVVEAELGRSLEDVFEWFAPQPMAAASIGQVHAARLPDGSEVAVKVQYPGVGEAIASDLKNADLLVGIVKMGMKMLGPLAPATDPRTLIDEIAERVGEELDYRLEAANQQSFWERYEEHPFIHIPAVVPELSTERVFTAELVDGMRWSAALREGHDLKNQWGEVIGRFVFDALYNGGLFNADPHPGNYLFHDDGSVTFLDFGCVKRFDQSQTDGMRRLAQAMVDGDRDELRRTFVDIGLLAPKSKLTGDRLYDWYAVMLEPLVTPDQPWTHTPDFAARVVASSYDVLGEWRDVIMELELQGDYVFLNRIQLGLNSVLAGLRATGNWAAISAEVRLGGPPASPLGEAHAAWKAARHGA